MKSSEEECHEQGRTVQEDAADYCQGMDEGFKQRLMSNPSAVLKEEGVEGRSDVEIRVVENTGRLSVAATQALPRLRLSEMSEKHKTFGQTVKILSNI